ncbi:cysteine dioxygenase family protein [Microvirga sp. HBU67558]|uniref:cysteine dioxygenase n=1 Tax=Microvirga TaxID=186650 RepID=UPI001B37E4EE|nr:MULTISPECIES: cysteine dioxygenase family protein [unclassified Microvirga]MBQ0822623.1 cysteine dioxygenase family protein [Microvirga sp. HBU67558]
MIEAPDYHNMLALFVRLSRLSQLPSDAYLENAFGVLEQVVANPRFLERTPVERKPSSFARSLVFGDNQLSVWAIAWAPGSSTPIHDHHCSCCFAVLSGTLIERHFSAVDEEHAALAQEMVRPSGFITCFLPSGPNIHQMSNESDGEAVSLHIYGFDHRMHGSSIHREYRAVSALNRND